MLIEEATSNIFFQLQKQKIAMFWLMEKAFFDHPVKNDERTYEKIQKNVTGPGDDYTTGYLLHYVYLKNYYRVIVIDLRKQQELDADTKVD